MTLQAFREARAEAKQQAVIEAATQLFAERGLKAVSMAALAETAGVSTATLYRHFDSKEQIFAAVVQRLVDDEFRTTAEAALNAPDPLAALCIGYANLLSNPTVLGCLRAVIAESAQEPGIREQLATHGNAILAQEFEAEIRALIANPDDLGQASLELRGAIEHFTLVSGLFFDETPDEATREQMIQRTLTSWRQRWTAHSGSMIGTQLAR